MLLTAIVSIVTVLADWVASRVIVGARVIRTLSQVLRAGLSEPDTIQRVQRAVSHYKASQSAALAWGADLATVAIALDFAALGIWVHNPQMFPFFMRLNSGAVSREISVWLIVIGLHVVLLVGSIILKHYHSEVVAERDLLEVTTFPSRLWFSRNLGMFLANSTGIISLLIAIVVFTDAI